MKTVTFSLVSEPDQAMGQDGKCEDVGTATLDLESLLRSGKDLIDVVVDETWLPSPTATDRSPVILTVALQ